MSTMVFWDVASCDAASQPEDYKRKKGSNGVFHVVCDAMQNHKQIPTFRSNILSPSSGLKSRFSKVESLYGVRGRVSCREWAYQRKNEEEMVRA
jgi:hypothetical protein